VPQYVVVQDVVIVPERDQQTRPREMAHRMRRIVFAVIESFGERPQLQWIRVVRRMFRRERAAAMRSWRVVSYGFFSYLGCCLPL
jgi:hypothetical protein